MKWSSTSPFCPKMKVKICCCDVSSESLTRPFRLLSTDLVQRSRLFHNLISRIPILSGSSSRTTQRPPGYVAHNISRDLGLVDCTVDLCVDKSSISTVDTNADTSELNSSLERLSATTFRFPHVQVYLACDLIMKELSEKRKDVSLAYLCTPTDVHVIPEDANKAAKKNYSLSKLANVLVLPFRFIWLKPNAQKPVRAENGDMFYIVLDGLSVAQGPNYATAKRLQHWRAMEARSRGCTVVSNVAPSTTTASVVSNRQFAWAYDGMPFFKPMEIFNQDTSNAVMATLLIHDIRNPQSVASAKYQLRNPLELFSSASFHGGVWRCGYKLDTLGETSVLIHFVKVLRPDFSRFPKVSQNRLCQPQKFRSKNDFYT
eukprot:g17544.t1